MTIAEIKSKITIKPYYEETDKGLIYNADCFDILRDIPDDSVDLVLTDPPYGVDFCSSWTSRKERLQNDKIEDWLNLMSQVLPEWKRILTNTGCCCCCCGGGGAKPVTSILTMKAIKYFNLIQTLVWRKFIGLGWRYRPSYENILILSKSKDNYNFYDESKSCSNVIEGINQDIPNSEEHPTQKPMPLIKKLLTIHSKENHMVMDSFAGSGTTALACKELNRKHISIEISEKYCRLIKNRLRQEILL